MEQPGEVLVEADEVVVIDPVVTDTAKMADFHLRVKPGADAWCLAALAAVLVQENLCNEAFLAEHVHGADEVREVLQTIPVGEYAQRSGVDEELLRAAARVERFDLLREGPLVVSFFRGHW